MTLGHEHILLVDDDEIDRYAAARALRAAGFDVTEAEGFADALTALDSVEQFDLLIVDVVMKVNGFALARMARLRRPDLRVLYVTGFEVPEVEAVGKVLHKPMANDELVRAAREALAEERSH